MWTGTREDGKDGKQELRPTKPDVGQAPAAGTMCGTKRVAPEKAALKMFARRPPDINAGKPPAGGGRAACVFCRSPRTRGLLTVSTLNSSSIPVRQIILWLIY
jgi:hypothetical protein